MSDKLKMIKTDAVYKAIELENYEKVEKMIVPSLAVAGHLKYAVEKQVSMDIIELLVENLVPNADEDVLEETMEIAVARGEYDEIRCVKQALAIAGHI